MTRQTKTQIACNRGGNATLYVSAQDVIEAFKDLMQLEEVTCDTGKPESEWTESDYVFIPPYRKAKAFIEQLQNQLRTIDR